MAAIHAQRRLAFITSLDPDAAAFINAASIAAAPERAAANYLARSLKSAGLWNELLFFYPMIGGTSRAHRLNFRDPRDANDAFRLTFYDAPGHSARGVAWNGSTQYADTYCAPASVLAGPGGSALGYYTGDNALAGDVYDMGSYVNANSGLFISTHNASFPIPRPFFSGYSNTEGAASNNSRGHWSINRSNANPGVVRLYLNGQWQNPGTLDTARPTVLPTPSIFLGAMHVSGVGAYGHVARGCMCAYFYRRTLSTSEISDLHTIVQQTQAILGRAN